MKRNEPKRHHYVAEFHQRGFTERDERLWLYDRRLQRYRKVHPRNICCENDLYTIDPEGNRNLYIELEWLRMVDRDGSNAIRRFKKGELLDLEWQESFSIYMAQQITRTPVFRDLTIASYRAMHEEYLRIGFTDVKRARQLLENYRRDTGDPANVTPESLVEAVVGGHIQVDIGEGPFLEHMVQQVEFLARALAAFEWEIIRAPADTGFILSDFPFVVIPAQGRPEDIGLGYPGVVKYFPLTRELCLRMGEQDYGFSYSNASKESVRVINQNVAVNSERFIMGPSREQLEHVIARSGTAETYPGPRTVVEAIQSDDDSALYRFNFWPRRSYFYPKTA